jgi:hypothetical protein
MGTVAGYSATRLVHQVPRGTTRCEEAVIDSNGVLRLRAEVEALKDQLAHAHKYWHHDLDVLDKAWAEVEALKATCVRREVLRVEALKRAVVAESELAVLKDAARAVLPRCTAKVGPPWSKCGKPATHGEGYNHRPSYCAEHGAYGEREYDADAVEALAALVKP